MHLGSRGPDSDLESPGSRNIRRREAGRYGQGPAGVCQGPGLPAQEDDLQGLVWSGDLGPVC